ncbi:ABC transporter ATP-binding protein [Nordella sp. HKS 07]|uniref:ABC transporter ATP-binding protein n=1 Tax=Nordella sp. HKS 07 TaxID=2712222 RepID=UPI0013E177BE|nr:ABC transporter ATP-binding protein [Nordella sp. HKS 07]QIG46729.1 ABC transporter ATP-binding protein [Nordella sp. HKS 07]
MLSVENLTTVVGTGASAPSVLEDVSFTLSAGEVLCVVGESGSGKSMLALTLMGLLGFPARRKSGRIMLAGEDITAAGNAAWRQKRGRDLSMIFQEPMTSLNPIMRVGEQIGEVLRMRKGMSGEAARRRAVELLERVEIPAAASRLSAYPHELSGGMRQRVMIAVALAAEPKLLIADEPTTALDVTIQAQILDLLRDIQAESGMALMLITHDLGVVAEMAHKVMVLYAGRVAEMADVETLFDAPAHPYTQALLASIPSLDKSGDRLVTIPGSVPGVGLMPKGCRFAPRCSHVKDDCRLAPPHLAGLGSAQSVACLRPFGYVRREEEGS